MSARGWRYQMRLLGARGEMAIITTLIAIIVLLVALFGGGKTKEVIGVLTTMILPALAAAGVAFTLSASTDPGLELELASPTPILRILSQRLCLILGYYIVLGLILSAFWSSPPLHPFSFGMVLAWLVPLLFFSGIALLMTLSLKGSSGGMAVALAIWAAELATKTAAKHFKAYALIYPFWMPGELSTKVWVTNRVILTLVALACYWGSFRLARNTERMMLSMIGGETE